MEINEYFTRIEVTYVYVEGEARGLVVPLSGNSNKNYYTDKLKYKGYMEVPYSYEKFHSFSVYQQKAICQSIMAKSGILINIGNEDACDPDKFYNE